MYNKSSYNIIFYEKFFLVIRTCLQKNFAKCVRISEEALYFIASLSCHEAVKIVFFFIKVLLLYKNLQILLIK